MWSKLCVYVDLDKTLYKKHLSKELMKGVKKPREFFGAFKTDNHWSYLKTIAAFIGAGLSLAPDLARKNFGTSQKMLNIALKDLNEEKINQLLEIGDEKVDDNIYPIREVLSNSKYSSELYIISMEPEKIQKAIAQRTGLNVKAFYQTRTVSEKIDRVKYEAENNPQNYYILIDDQATPQNYNNFQLMKDIKKLPQVLDSLNPSPAKKPQKERLEQTYPTLI